MVVGFSLPATARQAGYIYETIYVQRCRTDVLPVMVEINGKPDGKLFWNGTRIDWATFKHYLDNATRNTKDALTFRLHGDFSHRTEIVARLKRLGFGPHRCPLLPSIP